METITFTHSYNGKKVGALTQKTNFTLNGSLSLDEVISLFSHFVKAVWEAEVKVNYKFLNRETSNDSECCEQTNAIGFGFQASNEEENEEENEE